jgi:uncharacterized protein YqeY
VVTAHIKLKNQGGIRMAMQEKIRAELKESMKAGDAGRKDALRIILGEFQRQESKELDDAKAAAIIRKLIKSERERLDYLGQSSSPFLEVAESLLPKLMDRDQIRTWIEEEIDLSAFKNPMQAMGPIMKALSGKADGNVVKEVLQDMA